MIARFAVMGHPIAHSLSPRIHQLFAHQTGCFLVYDKMLVQDEQFVSKVRDFFNQGGCGLNITSPLKSRAFAMSDEVSERCLQAKAANTLWMMSGRLHADNTDGIGFLRDISRHVALVEQRILVLGAGGAARGILGPLLAESPALVKLFNRHEGRAEALKRDFLKIQLTSLKDLEDSVFDVIINTVSVGVSLSLPESIFANKPFCYDLSYNQSELTSFLASAKAQGSPVMDGLGMLVEQAAESFYIWHGVMPDTKRVLDTILKIH